MDPKAYAQMAEIEDHHWWFVARRAILSRVIRSLHLPEQPQILDVGCGSGGNLPMLICHGQVWGMEYSPIAREQAQSRGLATIEAARLPDQIPFAELQFDLITMLDVLEHLDQDVATLQALQSRLKPNGWLMLTVPAYQFLWSQHDVLNHHKRRYNRKHLIQVVQQANYRIRYSSYFNFFLFPLVLAIRLLQRLTRQTETDDLSIPSPVINRVLKQIFGFEQYLLGTLSLPFGVSLVLLAQAQPTPTLKA